MVKDQEPDEWLIVRRRLLFDEDSEGIYGAPAERGGDGVGVI